MKFNFEEQPVVDNHCHLFLPSKEDQPFERYWNFSFDNIELADCRNMMIFKSAIIEMARLFDMDPNNESAIIEKRNSYMKADPTAYWKMLAADAKIDTLIIDTGYPYAPVHGYSIEPDEFYAINPTNHQFVNLRIESFYQEYLDQGLAFKETVESYLSSLEAGIEKYQAVSLKTVSGYFTGLNFEVLTKETAKQKYDTHMQDKSNKAAEKGVRDYMLNLALELCLKYDLPMQIHCGFGNGPIMDLRHSNPLMLYDLFTHPHFGKAKYVICHCGYPYVAEAGYLVSQYQNVWADISAITPFASVGAESRLIQLFEMAPLSKVMFGTDGHNIPELYWFGTVYLKKCLARVFEKLVSDGAITEKYALEISKKIFSETARSFYRI